MNIKIYTRQYCYYCVRAKALLNELGAAYNEIKVDQDPEALAEMRRASARNTVPQIWIGERHIGGCDELYALHRQGGLEPLLRAP